MFIRMPEYVNFALKTLNSGGFEAYAVGGCIRDYLLGNVPDDFDICTNAKPDFVVSAFKKTILTGIKHGTVTAVIEGHPIEITTYRTESEYGDFRHPQKVEFVYDLKTDLSRRDFTVNAMCYEKDGKIIDLFGGKEDLKNSLMRAVGEPDLRFREDALRILRLFRFCSTLGFTAEKKTFDAAIENAYLLNNISRERIREELFKTACGKNPQAILPLLKTGALEAFRPNSDISRIPRLYNKSELKFFAFINLIGKNLLKSLEYLKCSNQFKNYCAGLSAAENMKIKTREDIKRILRICEADIFDLFNFKAVIKGEDVSAALCTAKDIIKNNEPYKISQLAINGREISKKGYRGEEIGKTQEMLLDAVIKDPSLNRKEKLISLI